MTIEVIIPFAYGVFMGVGGGGVAGLLEGGGNKGEGHI